MSDKTSKRAKRKQQSALTECAANVLEIDRFVHEQLRRQRKAVLLWKTRGKEAVSTKLAQSAALAFQYWLSMIFRRRIFSMMNCGSVPCTCTALGSVLFA